MINHSAEADNNRRQASPLRNASRSTNATGSGASQVLLLAGVAAVFVFLVLRNVGLHPSIFGDEWGYSLHSRLTDLASAPKPFYVYLSLFGLTGYAGSGFLECARVVNALFFVGAAPFIYFTTSKVASKPVAVFITMLSLVGPINTYTAYFMPEAMYFFMFWLLTWFILSAGQSRPSYYGTVIGGLLAVLMLVKVNAIFLLPGIAGFILYTGSHDKSGGSVKRSLTTLLCLVVTAAIARLALGYMFAGKAGFDILGTKYGALADSSLGSGRLSNMSRQILGILRGHVMGLVLLFGVPLASLMTIDFRRDKESTTDHALHAVEVYCAALMLPLLIAVAYFTASVVGLGPYESVARLHMRYYNFAFPLFMIIAAGELSASRKHRSSYFSWVAVLILAGLTIYSFGLLTARYSPNLIDSPELHGITASRLAFYLAGIIGICSMVVWAFDRRRGSQVFLFLLLPASVFCSMVIINSELRLHLKSDVYDDAGMFVRQVLNPDERAKLAVAGPELGSLFRVLFYVDSPTAGMVVLPQGAPFNRSLVSADRKWVLLIGDHAVPANAENMIAENGFTLFQLPTIATNGPPGAVQKLIDFSQPFQFGVINRISGVSGLEPFGRWSDGNEVKIEMASALPRSFDLDLSANAFGPNVSLPFSIRIGTETRTFHLSSLPGDVAFTFVTDGNVKVITIQVPQPTSPKELGLSDDDRLLGIALRQMTLRFQVQ